MGARSSGGTAWVALADAVQLASSGGASPFPPFTLAVLSVHLCWAAAACLTLPAPIWAAGLIWIKSNLAKKWVSYYRRLEISLPGMKKQIPDLSGFWMVLNIQSTTAEIRWCFCSIYRKHTGSDAADIKITGPFQEIWLGIFPGHRMLFKAQADRKEKNPKCYRNEGKYPELKAKLANFELVPMKVKQQFWKLC